MKFAKMKHKHFQYNTLFAATLLAIAGVQPVHAQQTAPTEEELKAKSIEKIFEIADNEHLFLTNNFRSCKVQYSTRNATICFRSQNSLF